MQSCISDERKFTQSNIPVHLKVDVQKKNQDFIKQNIQM